MKQLNWYVRPAKIEKIAKFINDDMHFILDIGCGNASPSVTKRWIPNSVYHGVDIQNYNLSDEEFLLIDKFWLVTENFDGYDAIPNEYYDVVILNHVIEHIRYPERLLDIVSQKIKTGGILYLAFPSNESLSLPSAVGTLNFSDDETHVWFPDLNFLVNYLLHNRYKVLGAGRSRNTTRFFIGCLIFLPLYIVKAMTGKLYAKGLHYFYNFESYVLAKKY